MIDAIERITNWLDEQNAGLAGDDEMRIMKLSEEVGEVVRAYIGVTGQNPRKGKTHTVQDLYDELADVAITALCALQHFTQDKDVTADVFFQKLASIKKRVGLED